MLGISKSLRNGRRKTTKISVLQVAIYFFYLSLLTTVLALPMQWISRKVSVDYGISTQSTQSWIKIMLSVLGELCDDVNCSYGSSMAYSQIPEEMVVSRVGTLCSVYNLLTFIQPVVIDPLYNDFSTLKIRN